MIKLQYNKNTGAVGNGYNDNIIVPEPYILITEDEHDKIRTDDKNFYFVEGNKLIAKEKKPIIQKEIFLKEFFYTSLGYIRFKPTLKNGSQIDFISLLPQYKAVAQLQGLPQGAFIYYSEPDFNKDFSDDYMLSLQHLSPAMTFEEYMAFELEVTNAYQEAFFG